MYNLVKFSHLAAAIVWMGGVGFMLFVLRPTAAAQLPPPLRLPLMAAAMGRFFRAVWVTIAVLLFSGAYLLAQAGIQTAPAGLHTMLAIGLLMFLLFGHLFFGPFRRLKTAVAAADWPEGGKRAAQIARTALAVFGLGWVAIAAALLWR